jgi:hypothetical protein
VAEADDRIRAALAQADEHVEVRRVRVRQAGGRHFVDLVVACRWTPACAGAHRRRQHRGGGRARARRRRRGRARGADRGGGRHPRARDRRGGARPEVREVHNVRVMRLPDGYELSMHVKLPRELSLDEAHGVVERPGGARRAEVPELGTVHTHIEPLSATDWAQHAADRRHGHRARGDRVGGEALHRARIRST